MTSAFANPQIKNTVQLPLGSIKEAVKFIIYLDYNYKLQPFDDNSNKYRFESRKFIREGAFIDIALLQGSGSATEIAVEVRKISGDFEKTREVKSASNHIKDIDKLIGNILKLSPEQKEMYKGVEASITPGKGLKEFTCSNCKKNFYANRKINAIAICPHCKTRNLVVSNSDGSGWGTFFETVFMVGNIFRGRK